MMKTKIFALIAAMMMILTLFGCQKKTKTVTCDGCGTEVLIEADSNMDDSWIIYCEDCELEFFGESGLVGPG